VFLVSKVLPNNASRGGTRTACERSLRRLGTDSLDCYLLHWRGSHPLEETIAAFAELRREGKIKAWGVSNFDEEDLEEAHAIAAEAGETIACNQVLYHLQERAVEHSVLPWCAKHGVALTAYSPFGSGDFPGPDTAGGRVLSSVAEAHGATPHQVALAFLVRDQAAFAIPKAADPKHQEQNSAAGELILAEDDIAQIERAFPLGPKPRSLPMI
jgi:diketogulonate reductase-like aldo/keto reductase